LTAAACGGSTIGLIHAPKAAAVFIAVLVPVLLIGTAVHVLAHGWFPRIEYGRLAPEPYGMTRAERTALARTALGSIVPFGGGEQELRDARLPSGRPAFGDRELRHMRDVRRYVLGLYLIHAIGIAGLVVLGLKRRTRRVVRDGLVAGALLTLGIASLVAVYVAVSPVSFLGGFHRFFFSGDSWRFAETDTLRRLFPDSFWSDTAVALGALVAAQALVLLGAAFYWRRQAIHPAPRRAAHARARL
jgi:integral membrane protein (TIGR01906 family)